mmetsp:Transcript_22218/g.61864  ORF Transcript_22218/g.61864 Transcript_22218/m.61864 type:complete len:356 (+) Transcript_22218:130-1197(+)
MEAGRKTLECDEEGPIPAHGSSNKKRKRHDVNNYGLDGIDGGHNSGDTAMEFSPSENGENDVSLVVRTATDAIAALTATLQDYAKRSEERSARIEAKFDRLSDRLERLLGVFTERVVEVTTTRGTNNTIGNNATAPNPPYQSVQQQQPRHRLEEDDPRQQQQQEQQQQRKEEMGLENDSSDSESDDSSKDPSERWETRFKQIRAYRIKHGDCRVKQRSIEHPKLGHWVDKQRNVYNTFMNEGYRKELGARKINHLQKRIDRLDSIEFNWGRKHPLPPSWDYMFEKLQHFREHTGHYDVPKSWMEDHGSETRTLALWLRNQRKEYMRYHSNKDTLLTALQAGKLKSTGIMDTKTNT